METTKAAAGSLSAETPWVNDEYFANRCRRRNQQSFISNASTSWCSRMRHSNRIGGDPFLKDNTEDHRPTANEVLTRFGVTEVGYGSRTPFILVQSAALERVPPPPPLRSPVSSHELMDHVHYRKCIDIWDRLSQSSGSSQSSENEKDETLATNEATIREDKMFNYPQNYTDRNFDRMEPCYDWYLTRDQRLNTILEMRSAHSAMGLCSSGFRCPSAAYTGGFLRRPRTAPEMKMTRGDRSTGNEWLVISKLKLLHRKTDSVTPSRFQQKVVEGKNLLNSIPGRDEDGLEVSSEEVDSEDALSWTTTNGVKGTTGYEDIEMDREERQPPLPGRRNSPCMTPSPRDVVGAEVDVANVDYQDPHLQNNSSPVLRIASGVSEGSAEEQSDPLGPIICLSGEDHEINDGLGVSSDKELSILLDKELSIPSGHRLPSATDDNSITQLENDERLSPESSDVRGTNEEDLSQTLRMPAPVAATAPSMQRPKTAGRRTSSANDTRHRCLRKEAASGRQKTNDSKQQVVQQQTNPKDRGPQRLESRRKRRSRNRQTLISDENSLVSTAVDDDSPVVESLIEQFSSCPEIPSSSEDIPSADFKLSNCTEDKASQIESTLSLRRRSLVDAAIQRNLSIVKLSRSEGEKKTHAPLPNPPLEVVGGTEGEAVQIMDSHKADKSKQNGRIAFSQRSCRFELPMDMKQFEKLSPQDYLRKYCRISARRQILYKRIFLKYVPLIGWFPGKDLLRFLTELLGEAASDSDVAYICELLEISDETKIDLELFSAAAAVTERLLYPQFVTQHTRHIQDYKKEEIEKADFSALLMKLNGIRVRPEMKRLVDAIK